VVLFLLLPGCAAPAAINRDTGTPAPPPPPPSTPWLLVENTTTLIVGPGPVPGVINSGVYGVANENCLFLSSDGFNTRHILVRSVNATLAWTAATPLAEQMALNIHGTPAVASYTTDYRPSPLSLEVHYPFGNETVHSLAIGAWEPPPASGKIVVHQEARLTVRVEFTYIDQDEAPRFVLGTC
jgi:hypothetical protein